MTEVGMNSTKNIYRAFSLISVLAALFVSGCAALTNPAANGLPARLVPDELLAESKEDLVELPLSWLSVKTPEVYTLDSGDILGVYIEGILPQTGRNLPISFPQTGPPVSGVPIVVRENGTISLPWVGEIDVKGLSVQEAQNRVIETYTESHNEDTPDNILPPENTRIMVGLMHERRTRIRVIREDSPTARVNIDQSFRTFGNTQLESRRGSGIGTVLELPSVSADVLSVLANSGGLPGPFASNEVIIYRGGGIAIDAVDADSDSGEMSDLASKSTANGARVIRIPMRIKPGTEKPFDAKDVHLQPDDVVFVPARDFDVYYTGGVLPARAVPLPRDYDLPALEAVLRIGGSVINGGRFANNFTGGITAAGLGAPNPSLLTVIRRLPGGSQVNIRVDLNRALTDPRENILIREGDVLLLQETPSEAVARYFSSALNLNGATQIFARGSAAATGSVALP